MTLRHTPVRPTDNRASHTFDSLRLTAASDPGNGAIYLTILGEHFGAIPAERLLPMTRWARSLLGDMATVRRFEGVFTRIARAHAGVQATLGAPAPVHSIRVRDHRIHFVIDPAAARFIKLNLVAQWPYEAGVMRYMLARLAPDDVFADVGAHAGYFSLIASSLGAVAYAIEPQRDLIRVIERNAAINGAERLHALPLAVSNRDGMTSMLRLGGSPGMQMHGERIGDNHATPQNRHVDWIPTVRLDTLFGDELVRPRFVKIDVEGLELRALAGAARLIDANATAFIVELHPHLVADFGGDLKDLGRMFEGPRWRAVDVSSDPPVPIALADGLARALRGTKEEDGRVTLAIEPSAWRPGPWRAAP